LRSAPQYRLNSLQSDLADAYRNHELVWATARAPYVFKPNEASEFPKELVYAFDGEKIIVRDPKTNEVLAYTARLPPDKLKRLKILKPQPPCAGGAASSAETAVNLLLNP